MNILAKLNNRPKSIRFIVTYSSFAIVLLTLMQIIYVAEIVPMYLKTLSNYDPFAGNADIGAATKDASGFLRFISGFSSGLVATVVEIALISAFRLNKPYRQRSYVNVIISSFLSLLLAGAYLLAMIIGRQAVNSQNVGSVLSFFLLTPLLPYLFRSVVKSWSKPKEVEFPSVDLDK